MKTSEALHLLTKIADIHGSHTSRVVNQNFDPTQMDQYDLWLEMPQELVPTNFMCCVEDNCDFRSSDENCDKCPRCGALVINMGPPPELVHVEITSCWTEDVRISSPTLNKRFLETDEDESGELNKLLNDLVFNGNWKIEGQMEKWWSWSEKDKERRTLCPMNNETYLEYFRENNEWESMENRIGSYV
ncbi:hypothetical protein C4565_00430 [Candidatus Parcubacteria bacterium]|nr:MAG: hypothetical protein C4565_00430 [Candidatus Parcubacteria bacterium]